VGKTGPPREPGGVFTVAFTSGFTLLAGMFIGYVGGRYLDGLLGVSPWLSLVGVILGVVAGFRVLLRDLLRVTGGEPPDESEPPDDEGARGSEGSG